MTKFETKAIYAAPSLRKMGRVEAITEAAFDGKETDAAFPANTPFSDVTFS